MTARTWIRNPLAVLAEGDASGGVVVEVRAVGVDGRGRHAGFDQFDPSAIHDPVVGRGRHGHGPAEVPSGL